MASATIETQSKLSSSGIPWSPTTEAVRVHSEDVGRILGMRMPVCVTLAERDMPLKAILEMTVGTIIEFDVPVETNLTLVVANRPIGQGHAVKCGENFGLRVTNIDTVHQRIGAMGGRLDDGLA